jgi:mersacidin/lichenicidin family type 2 lantibiotic
MLSEKIIPAWKDIDYRLSPSEAERTRLPDHPGGLAELTQKELNSVVGGFELKDWPHYPTATPW